MGIDGWHLAAFLWLAAAVLAAAGLLLAALHHRLTARSPRPRRRR